MSAGNQIRFGRFLWAHRVLKDFTPARVAAALRIPIRRIVNLEAGISAKPVTPVEIERFAVLYGIDPEDLTKRAGG